MSNRKSIRTIIIAFILLILPYIAIKAGARVGPLGEHTSPALAQAPVVETVQDPETNISCDAASPCPAGMECWTLVGSGQEGPSCVAPTPQTWYCPGGTKPLVTKSDPPAIQCEVPTGN